MLSRLAGLFLVVFSAWFLFVRGLGNAGLLSVDEPRYVWIGRAMAESGDWISPCLFGQPWLEKPPLMYWLTAMGWKVGLTDEWAARFTLAVLAVAFLVLFWWSLAREFDTEAATLSTAILASSVGWLVYSHVAVADLPLAVTFGAAMLFAWRGWLRWAGVMLGFAVLAKALVPLVLVLPALWWLRARWRELIVPALLAAAVSLPWYVSCYQRHGRQLIDELFIRHHFARFFDAKAQVLHPQPFWFYLPVLAVMLLPWTPISVAGLRRWVDPSVRYFLLWLGFGLVFFSASSGKLPGYLLPLMPAAAALSGISSAAVGRSWRASVAALAVLLFCLPDARLLGAIVGKLAGLPLQTGNWLWIGLAAASAAAVLASSTNRRAISVSVLAMGSLVYWAGRSAERHTARPFKSMASDVCAGEGLHRQWQYGLAYYAHAPVPECRAEAPQRWEATSADTGRLYLRERK
ncbi:MAG: glycosyltransferase family 39 protein [Acidobacteria bacterium]|nr:glycosyltransferase family 39 protein [Acidobacteriota bacterium]